MEMEHSVKVIPIDAKYQEETEKLRRDGWEQVQGVTPVAIFHLIRPKQQPMGIGTLTVDDAGVFIIPAKKNQQ